MWVVVGVLPGLSHALSGGPTEPHLRRRAALAAALAGAPAGLLFDGAWGIFPDPLAARDASLAAAGLGGAIACCAIGDLVGEPPMVLELLWAEMASRTVRQGEVVVPSSLWSGDALPRGVARSSAPTALQSALGSVDLIRDYRD